MFVLFIELSFHTLIPLSASWMSQPIEHKLLHQCGIKKVKNFLPVVVDIEAMINWSHVFYALHCVERNISEKIGHCKLLVVVMTILVMWLLHVVREAHMPNIRPSVPTGTVRSHGSQTFSTASVDIIKGVLNYSDISKWWIWCQSLSSALTLLCFRSFFPFSTDKPVYFFVVR